MWDPIKPAPPVRRTLILAGAPINISLGLSFGVPFGVPLGEPLDGAQQTLFGRDARLPAQSFPCSRDIRASLLGIVLRECFIDGLARAAREFQDKTGHFPYCVLYGVAEVYGASLLAPH